MKEFDFGIAGYEATRNENTLHIYQLDHEGDRISMIPLEITMTDLGLLMNEAERLQAYYNPTCSEVTSARTDLENARGKTGHEFEAALTIYMNIANRHKEASGCTVVH